MSVKRFDVIVSGRPRTGIAFVRIMGQIDMAADPRLAEATAHLFSSSPQLVLMDLGAVTFADSTLINFVARVRNVLPTDGSLLLCRSNPPTRLLLEITAMNQIATIRDDLPGPWITGHDGQFYVRWPAPRKVRAHLRSSQASSSLSQGDPDIDLVE